MHQLGYIIFHTFQERQYRFAPSTIPLGWEASWSEDQGSERLTVQGSESVVG